MDLKAPNPVVYIPDDVAEDEAFARTTHMAVGAHQDDLEVMAYHGIVECFRQPEKWFAGVVCTDGATSPRADLYADVTNDEMAKIRIHEQKKAAFVGEYGSQVLLGYTSGQSRDAGHGDLADDLETLFLAAAPEVVYLHNLCDKHITHVGVALRALEALRRLPGDKKPSKVYGCEVWRNLDWVNDDMKEVLPVTAHPNLAAALIGVFDSQICGGKRYDLASEGRKLANATFFASHDTDEESALWYATDLTPLVENPELSFVEYADGYIDAFKNNVHESIKGLL